MSREGKEAEGGREEEPVMGVVVLLGELRDHASTVQITRF